MVERKKKQLTEISSEAASAAPLVLLRTSDPCPTSGIFVPGLRLEAVSIVRRLVDFFVLNLLLLVMVSVVPSLCSPTNPPSKLCCGSLGGEIG